MLQAWAFARITVKHLLETFCRLGGQIPRVLNLALLNVLVENLDIVIVIWRYANEHLVEDHANLINITSLSHTFLLEHLRSEVRGRAAEGLSLYVTSLLSLLGQSKVGESNVTIRVEKDILWLQVTEQNALLV